MTLTKCSKYKYINVPLSLPEADSNFVLLSLRAFTHLWISRMGKIVEWKKQNDRTQPTYYNNMAPELLGKEKHV